MNGATLKTLREALCLPVSWLAAVCGVQERTVRYWESGTVPVPQDVSDQIEQLEMLAVVLTDQVVSSIRQQVAQHGDPGEPIRLVRYAEAEDMARFQPELATLPPTFHAAILARIRWALEPDGLVVEAHNLNVPAYMAWLKATNQEESPTMRAQFIATED